MPPQFEILSDEFQRIVRPSAGIELVADRMIFTEGTTWVPDRNMVIWSDFFNNRIMQWSESGGIDVFRQPSNRVNGNTIDLEGRVVSCETSGRKVVREEPDGTITIVAERYEGGRFTSPNDVVVKSDGSIWFTDPDYGILVPGIGDGEMPEQDRNRVYRVDPDTGQVESACEEFDKPNGLAFSPDESVLYIADSGRTHGEFRNHHVMTFDVVDGGARIENPAVLAVVDPGVPDGNACGYQRQPLRCGGRRCTGVFVERGPIGQNLHTRRRDQLRVWHVRLPDAFHRRYRVRVEGPVGRRGSSTEVAGTRISGSAPRSRNSTAPPDIRHFET